jgi:tetratricopeptide (TPR) repeat protein
VNWGLKLDPPDSIVRAKLHRHARRFDAALADADAALALSPEHVPALLLRAELHGLTGNMVKVAEDCLTALKHEPKSAEAAYLLARILALSEQPGPALKFLEQAIANGFDNLAQARKLRDFKGLRALPRFRKLVGLE